MNSYGCAALALWALALQPLERRTSSLAQVHCTVRLVGTPPPERIVAVDKDVEHCGSALRDNDLLLSGNAVAGAVVWLQGAPGATLPAGEAGETRIATQSCRMEPRVQAARVGSRLVLRNSDPVTHNPHGWSGRRTVFNVTLIDQELEVRRTLKEPGVHRIDCDTHRWMHAYVHVFDHPWYAITGEGGQAWIRDLPPGARQVRFWHEVLGERTVKVDLRPGQTTEVVLEFDLEQARPPAEVPAAVDSAGPTEGGTTSDG